MNHKICTLKSKVNRSMEFQRKGLATHTVNVGVRCGHNCTYCSTPSLLRMHPAFRILEERPFTVGPAIIDPEVADRLRHGRFPRLRSSDTVMICSTTDAWAPEARHYGLGRECLEAILERTDAEVRVLTKSSAIVDDYDLIEKHKDRVVLSISTTMPTSKSAESQAVEPSASAPAERFAAIHEAANRGLRIYGMICPVLPLGNAGTMLADICDELPMDIFEDVWIEPVNARGNGLIRTRDALEDAGLSTAAKNINAIRNRRCWSSYVQDLCLTTNDLLKKGMLPRGQTHVLVYGKHLTPGVDLTIKCMPEVIWL